jgi:hypothetical protein
VIGIVAAIGRHYNLNFLKVMEQCNLPALLAVQTASEVH